MYQGASDSWHNSVGSLCCFGRLCSTHTHSLQLQLLQSFPCLFHVCSNFIHSSSFLSQLNLLVWCFGGRTESNHQTTKSLFLVMLYYNYAKKQLIFFHAQTCCMELSQSCLHDCFVMSECGHFKRYSFEVKKKRQIIQQSDFLILFFSTQTCGHDPLTSVCNCLWKPGNSLKKLIFTAVQMFKCFPLRRE